MIAVLCSVGSSTGCTMFSQSMPALPSLSSMIPTPFSSEGSAAKRYVPVGAGAALPSSSFNEDVYHAVRRAKESNSIVLQVVGESGPVRVLPLPSPSSPAGSPTGEVPTVYVSTLLKQTGVIQKLGAIEAALFRSSPSSFEGIRMDVTLSRGEVRPECDYALRPGDRLVVREDNKVVLDSVVKMVLGR